jgi:glucokinase
MILGLDIGGTKIRAGLVDPSGRIAGDPVSVPTGAHDSAEDIFARIASLVRKAASGCECMEAIGVGCTGPLDPENGIILECNNLPTMHGFPLKSRLEDIFGVPVKIDNDANALVLGEAMYGAGKGFRRVLGLTLGTGLGSALVVDGKMVSGANSCCGEIWISPYKDGIMEDYLSGTAITSMYDRIIGKASGLNGAQIASLARHGDSMAMKIFDEFASSLAFALAWTVNMTDPDAVVLGGSVMDSSDLFLDKADALFRRYVCPEPARNVKLRLSALGADAGVIGAAALLA